MHAFVTHAAVVYNTALTNNKAEAAVHLQLIEKTESESKDEFGCTTLTFTWGYKAFAKGGVFPDWNERAEWRFLKHRDLWQPLCRLLITADMFIKHSILHRWCPQRGSGGGWTAWHIRSSHTNAAGGNKLVGGNPIVTAQSFIHVLLHQWSCGARPSRWSMLFSENLKYLLTLLPNTRCFAFLKVVLQCCVCRYLSIHILQINLPDYLT